MYRYKKNKNSRLKRLLKTFVLIIIVSTCSIFLYQMYLNIEIKDENNVIAKKVSTEVEDKDKLNNNDISKDITEILEQTNLCVVGISKIKNNGTSIFLKEAEQKLGLGTGVIVSDNGYILTNEHVSGKKYSNCYVTLSNGKNYNATVVWSDSDIDLSIVKINANGLNYIELGDSDDAKIGQVVYAIGNPIGFEFRQTVTSGIISGLNRTIKIEEGELESYMEDLIQTDATINPGNSGGPLINSEGKMIGINSIKITTAEGIGFAMPINIVKPIITKFIKDGNFDEASIGLFAYDKEVIPYLNINLNFEAGIYIAQVKKNSPAYNSGLKEGDIITKIDGIELNKMSELRSYIYTKNVGDIVNLTISRNNKSLEVSVKLGRKV